MDFMNKVFSKDVDDNIHEMFIRFGKGVYNNRAIIKLHKTKEVKVSSSFEYVRDFSFFLVNLANNFDVQGLVVSKDPMPELGKSKVKKGLHHYEVNASFDSNKLKDILEKSKYTLLNINAEGIELKCKQKIPKPGKSENKIDSRFCQMKLDMKHWPKVRKELFPELDENCKKAVVSYKVEVTDIIVPENTDKAEDYELLRHAAKRKGKLTQMIEQDQLQSERHCDFLV